MKLQKSGFWILGGMILFFLIITIIALFIPASTAFAFLIRLFALWGLYFLLIASIMTPFQKQLYKAFGSPFLKLHHFIAGAGIILATLHPINFAIQQASILVFLPDFSSWLRFWELAGRPALILIYIAALAAILRKKIPKSWRTVHGIMYIILLMGIIHGNLIGTDFQNLGVSLIFNGLFGVAVFAMILKQYLKLQQKKKKAIAKSKRDANANK